MGDPGQVEAGVDAVAAGSAPGPSVGAYPSELETSVVLADGREVFVRPIRPDDADALRGAIEAADYDTLHARFLGSAPTDDASIRRLVEVDYDRRLALVALAADGRGVAVARYEGQPGSTRAEIAVAVDVDYRRVGLGSALVRRLGEAALARGITRFTAVTLAENRPALSVLTGSGLPYTLKISQATAEIVMALDGDDGPSVGSADT